MNKRTLTQTAILVIVAAVLALGANALAGRERRMMLVGFYPNAQRVPARETTAPAPKPIATPAVTVPPVTSSQLPVAVQPTTTTQAPAVTGNRQPVTQPKEKPAPPTAPAPTPKTDALAKFAPHEKQPYIEIAYDDVKTLHDHGALTLDARRTSVYEQGHIAGARPMSVWESDIDDKVAKLFNERSDPAQQALPIVVYCSGGDCEDSHMLAQKLYGAMFNNVYVYKDGFPDWQKHGGAVHMGVEP